GITKLALQGDTLIGIQEKALAILPVDANIIETTDGTTQSIRSSVVVDTPRYISRQYGSQHLKGITQIDSALFIPDAFNKVVIKLQDGVEIISENGMIENFAAMLTPTSDLKGIYDNK